MTEPTNIANPEVRASYQRMQERIERAVAELERRAQADLAATTPSRTPEEYTAANEMLRQMREETLPQMYPQFDAYLAARELTPAQEQRGIEVLENYLNGMVERIERGDEAEAHPEIAVNVGVWIRETGGEAGEAIARTFEGVGNNINHFMDDVRENGFLQATENARQGVQDSVTNAFENMNGGKWIGGALGVLAAFGITGVFNMHWIVGLMLAPFLFMLFGQQIGPGINNMLSGMGGNRDRDGEGDERSRTVGGDTPSRGSERGCDDETAVSYTPAELEQLAQQLADMPANVRHDANAEQNHDGTAPPTLAMRTTTDPFMGVTA